MSRDIITDINKKIPEMSKSHKLIASYITEHPDTAAYLTATKLGEVTGVSESTVVRFAIEIGYKGYPEMQKSLRNKIKTNMTSVQRVAVANNLMSGSDLLSGVMSSDMDKIKMTLDEIDRDAFLRAVELISGAKRVYIIGMRSASMLSSFFAYYLNIVLNNVILLDMTSSSEMFERLMWISEDDVFIGISYPRYSKRTKKAMEFAKEKGASILALTDSENSPIADCADCALFAKSDMASFVDSLVAPLSVINALTVAISMKNGDELSRRLEDLEKIWDKYDVYEKTN